MRKIDKQTGEILSIKPGGLYAPLPIPAYQVLFRSANHQAQKVFVCLVSHLGSNGTAVFPSYSTIAYESGISRNGIKPALEVLEHFGFIKIGRWIEGKKDRNTYYIQEACYDSHLMNKFAKQYRDCEGACRKCGAALDKGDFKIGPNGAVHLGCGGSVKVKGIKSESPYKLVRLKTPRHMPTKSDIGT